MNTRHKEMPDLFRTVEIRTLEETPGGTMRYKSGYGVIFLCLFHFSRILVSAQITEAISTNSLLGVTGLAVSIGELSPGMEKSGLSVGQLRADAESKLKAGGIK